MDRATFPDPTVDVEVGLEIAIVTQTGKLRSVKQALDTQRAIESALVGTGVRDVLFDNRGTIAPSRSIRNAMWSWLQSGRVFDRVALVLKSIVLGRWLNLAAMSHNVPVRVFSDPKLARDWLTTSENWVHADLLVFEDGQMAYAVPARSVAKILPWTEPIAIPGVREDSDSLIGDAILGMIEYAGCMVAVRRLRRARAHGSGEAPRRLIVFEDAWGGFALPATETHVAGRVQLAAQPHHDRDLDSTIGMLRYLDPLKLGPERP